MSSSMLRSSYSENLQKEKKDQSDHGDSEEKGVGLHVSNLERAKEGPGGQVLQAQGSEP